MKEEFHKKDVRLSSPIGHERRISWELCPIGASYWTWKKSFTRKMSNWVFLSDMKGEFHEKDVQLSYTFNFIDHHLWVLML